MQIPTKKLNNGFELPIFGLGTWQMGGRETHDPANNDEQDIAAIQEAIQLGITHIDTAESYADGYTEILVGKAIKNIDRSSLFITSKIRPRNLRYDDVLKSCTESLKRLQTDYLDLYMIHKPNDEISIAETMSALDRLVTEGLVKYIGVSDFGTARFIEAQKHTNNKIVVNQVYYNLIIRGPEHEGMLRHCQENDVLLQAYRPLEKGSMLTDAPAVLNELAKKYQKTPAQIAINWLLSQENVTTLSKSSSSAHLQENLGAVGWQMDAVDIEKLRKEFPDQQEKSAMLPLR
jgi:diketogulonate reductase-like aldo/keto reductase